jgi:hypothetical protein
VNSLKKCVEEKNDPEDFIEQEPDENGNIKDYHIRAKGLSTKCVEYRAKEFGITPVELYEKLFNGEEIEFDLCADHAVKFEKLKGDRFSWRTRTEFKRCVSF